jgi:hypothetical protein
MADGRGARAGSSRTPPVFGSCFWFNGPIPDPKISHEPPADLLPRPTKLAFFVYRREASAGSLKS